MEDEDWPENGWLVDYPIRDASPGPFRTDPVNVILRNLFSYVDGDPMLNGTSYYNRRGLSIQVLSLRFRGYFRCVTTPNYANLASNRVRLMVFRNTLEDLDVASVVCEGTAADGSRFSTNVCDTSLQLDHRRVVKLLDKTWELPAPQNGVQTQFETYISFDEYIKVPAHLRTCTFTPSGIDATPRDVFSYCIFAGAETYDPFPTTLRNGVFVNGGIRIRYVS